MGGQADVSRSRRTDHHDMESDRSNVMKAIESKGTDHDDMGSDRSNAMKLIESNNIDRDDMGKERDHRDKPASVFMHPALWFGAAALAVSGLAGCASFNETNAPQDPAPPRTSQASSPPAAMGGRWTLSTPGGSSCMVTLGGAAGASEGTVAPEGGCPGNFFTTRKWTFEGGELVMRDHTGQPLGQLTPTPSGGYEGRANGGMSLTLAR